MRITVPIVANPHREDTCDPVLHPTLLHMLDLPIHSPLWQHKQQTQLLQQYTHHALHFKKLTKRNNYSVIGACGKQAHRLIKTLQNQRQTPKRSSSPKHTQRRQHANHHQQNVCPKTIQQTPIDKIYLSLGNQRIIKTRREIARIQRACQITSRIMLDTIQNAHTCRTTESIYTHLHRSLCQAKRKPMTTPMHDLTAYTTILTLNQGDTHHKNPSNISRVHPEIFEDQPLHANKHPLLLLDFGARHGGYCADITRTFAYTQPTPRQIQAYKAVHRLYTLGESMVKPGVLYANIDKAVKKQLSVELQQLGYPDYANTQKYMPHGLGHSVGIEVHDNPSIFKVGPLQPNMVLTIEPGMYTDEFDIRIENTIVVTHDGCRVLSDGVPWSVEFFMTPMK